MNVVEIIISHTHAGLTNNRYLSVDTLEYYVFTLVVRVQCTYHSKQ